MVGAALRRDGVPRRALLAARERGRIALSPPVLDEIAEVLARPKFAAAIPLDRRAEIIGLLTAAAAWFEPGIRVRECRDPGDDIYLELALAAGAAALVSSDADLLVLDPWRGIRILRPAEFLTLV